MKFCITGGVGFIGQATASLLANRGDDLVALDNLNPQVHRESSRAIEHFPGEVIVGDVRDEVTVSRAIDSCDAVIHLAAETGTAQSMYEQARYLSVNADGTDVVARAARAADIGLVLASSRAVYGEGAYDCVQHGRSSPGPCCRLSKPDLSREDDPLAPVSTYGESKLLAEQAALRSLAGVTPLAIARPQNVVGAGQAIHNPYTGVLAAFAARLKAGLPPEIYGTGGESRDFVDIEDTARLFVWLADWVTDRDNGTSSRRSHVILNIGSGRRTSLFDLATLTIRIAGYPDLEPTYRALTRRGDIKHACADLDRLETTGAPRPSRHLSESVARFLEYSESLGDVDLDAWEIALAELEGGTR